MSATEILEQIRALPPRERNEVVEQIMSEFDLLDHELTPAQIAELDRRAEDALKHPGRRTSVEEVSAEIRKRLLAKK
jgi:putative addiction module component (TIGR02574 family)